MHELKARKYVVKDIEQGYMGTLCVHKSLNGSFAIEGTRTSPGARTISSATRACSESVSKILRGSTQGMRLAILKSRTKRARL
jgi:hypothetical protein